MNQKLTVHSNLYSQAGSKAVWKELGEDDTLKDKQQCLSNTT